jgi:hypothetical protein
MSESQHLFVGILARQQGIQTSFFHQSLRLRRCWRRISLLVSLSNDLHSTLCLAKICRRLSCPTHIARAPAKLTLRSKSPFSKRSRLLNFSHIQTIIIVVARWAQEVLFSSHHKSRFCLSSWQQLERMEARVSCLLLVIIPAIAFFNDERDLTWADIFFLREICGS